MNVRVYHDDLTAKLILEGRFGFDDRQHFSGGVDAALATQAGKILVDLRKVTYLDSAALGMLLLLRDKATAAGKSVAIASESGTVRDILKIACFEKLFEME